MRKLILFILVGMANSCSQPVPRKYLQPEKMQAVYWDYMQVEAFVKNFVVTDTAKNAKDTSAVLLKSLFQKHDVTRKEFNESIRYYAANEVLMQNLLDTMVKRHQQPPVLKTDTLKVQ